MRRLALVIAVVAVLVTMGCSFRAPASAALRITRNVSYTGSAQLDVFAPSAARRAPVIVTLHGCCGTGEDLFQLAYGLAAAGAVVFNPSWWNLDEGGGYPVAYQQAACAVAFARARAADYGGDPRRVTVVGWSDGALLGGVVANGADGNDDGGGPGAAADCVVATERALPPDAFVAVGGFLGWPAGPAGPSATVDPAYVNDGTVRWFGGTPDSAPEAWAAGNPYTGLGHNRGVAIRLVVGRDDDLLPDNQRFLDAARAAGLNASLTIAEEAGDQTIVAPRTREGKLAVREILAAARMRSRA